MHSNWIYGDVYSIQVIPTELDTVATEHNHIITQWHSLKTDKSLLVIHRLHPLQSVREHQDTVT